MKKQIISHLIYSFIFTAAVVPFLGFTIKAISAGYIIGFFAAIFNDILANIKRNQ